MKDREFYDKHSLGRNQKRVPKSHKYQVKQRDEHDHRENHEKYHEKRRESSSHNAKERRESSSHYAKYNNHPYHKNRGSEQNHFSESERYHYRNDNERHLVNRYGERVYSHERTRF